MANILFLVFLMTFSVALTRECNNIKSCDDCIRCGNEWCYNSKVPYCIPNGSGETCPGRVEKLATNNEDTFPSIPVKKIHEQLIKYNRGSGTTSEPIFVIHNSTQTDKVNVKKKSEQCKVNECQLTIDVSPSDDFCTNFSTTMEYFDLKVNSGIYEKSFRYHVPCSCNCNDIVEEKSKLCNGQGDYSCGVCTCKKGWEGAFCEKEICPQDRGDIPPCNTDEDCHGNGKCTCTGCKCFENPKRHYINENCKDICSVAQDSCLLQPDFENPCETSDGSSLYFTPYNETSLDEYDLYQQLVWVNCNRTFDECLLQYAAKIDAHHIPILMITKSCDPEMAAASVALPIALPVVLGLVALLGSAAAVAGYVFWKNKSPQLPLNDPQYQNIDADFSQGENPLYKSPTSNFNNPTYGKW